ncbi:MAG: PEP-CTERM sorting domain-containing protein [Cyanobacteria bacterium J06635_10]
MKFFNKLTVSATNLEQSINREGYKKMKFFNKLTFAAVAVVLGLAAIPGEANAASFGPTEMVINGEFEETQFGGSWKPVSESEVPGWETTNNNENIRHRSNNKIELWNQGKIGSPAMGSDGLGTGKHMETNFNGIETISQTFTLAENIDTTATFSFDAWSRRNGTGMVSVEGSLSGIILNEAIEMNGNSWTQNLFELAVTGGEDITIAFQGDQANSVDSAHIDQVSFMVNKRTPFAKAAAVPEPASILGLLAVGAFSSASTLKRKKSMIKS